MFPLCRTLRRLAVLCVSIALLLPASFAQASFEPELGFSPSSNLEQHLPDPPVAAGRAFTAPAGGATAWLVPGPEPELWVSRPGVEPQLLLRGQMQHFAALQWAPDGQSLAVLVVPTGTGTQDLGLWYTAELAAANVRPQPVATPPPWVNLAAEPAPALTTEPERLPHVAAVYTPPEYIRVYHSQHNTCRNVPVGQIDRIPFEEYVARVVAAEVYSSWEPAALQAQAIAVRTYAWYFILQNQADYDVTDSTAYQYMCDRRYPSTDQAAAATEGRYLAYNGAMIVAEYSAENSHPTADSGRPYMIPVVDPVGLGKTRYGHGRGLSQWGAQRWALYHGWNAAQILTHYYTGVQIVDPKTADPWLVLRTPWPGAWLTGSAAHLSAHASGEAVTVVDFEAPGFAQSDGDGADGWSAGWPLSDSLAGPLTLTARAAGRSHTVSLAGRDGLPPAGQLTVPASSASLTITARFSAQDSGGSGLTRLAIGPDWQVRATDFVRESGSGQLVEDAGATGGSALWLPAGSESRWKADVSTTLADGKVYGAYARLKISGSGTAVAGRVEIYNRSNNRLVGFADLRPGDWRQAAAYQEFLIDCWLPANEGGNLGIRVIAHGSSHIMLDRVRLLPEAQSYEDQVSYVLARRSGQQPVIAKVLDTAGNPSEDLVAVVDLIDSTPPGNWQILAPSGVVTSTVRPEVIVTVADDLSAIAISSAEARYSVDGGASWSEWQPAAGSATSSWSAELRFEWPGGDGGDNNLVQFRVSDAAGLSSTSPAWTVRVDTGPPPVTLLAPNVVRPDTPFRVRWQAQAGGNPASYDVQTSPDGMDWQDWLTATTDLEEVFPGVPAQGIYFRARARNLDGRLGEWSAAARVLMAAYWLSLPHVSLQ